jgi:rhodanese-related sulfurtransferase
LLPLSDFARAAGEKLIDPQQPLLIYCHHGVRSARAAEFLLQQGFTSVTSLAGGIDAWAMDVDPGIGRY